MTDRSIVEVPLLPRPDRLPRLPGQPKDTTYVLVNNICPQPQDSLGYLAERIDPFHARLIACLAKDGRVLAVTEPVEEFPEVAGLLIAKEHDNGSGGIYLAVPGISMTRVGAYEIDPPAGFREVTPDKGCNRSQTLRPFIASLYLRYLVFPNEDVRSSIPVSLRAHEIDAELKQPLDTPVEIFEHFNDTPLPDALEALLFRLKTAQQLSGIEQFALRLFAHTDLNQLREIALRADLQLARIERTRSFYLKLDQEKLSPADLTFLFALEATFNRISRVLDAMGAGLAPITASPTEAACIAIDKRVLSDVGSSCRKLLARAFEPNRWAAPVNPSGYTCEAGGEWDVRTRLASTCEHLNLVFRLEYNFRFHAAKNLIGIQFIQPDVQAMQAWSFDAATNSWHDLEVPTRETMAHEMAARMALVLAAACFSSGATIERCAVQMQTTSLKPARSFSFERGAFVSDCLSASDNLDRFSLVDANASHVLAPFEVAHDHPDLDVLRVPAPGLATPAAADERALPSDLQRLLLADTAQELAIMDGEDDPWMLRLQQTRSRESQDLDRAGAEYARIIEEIQASCAAKELLASRPLVSRYADELWQRMLMGYKAEDPDLRIYRLPHALFEAQLSLTNLYAHAGRTDDAIREARNLLDIAPVSSRAHFSLINLLAYVGRFDEVIEVARHGMPFAYDLEDCAYYLYRLAFALWTEGDHTGALACYSMMPNLGNDLDQTARTEMQYLLSEMGLSEPPAIQEIKAALAKRGIDAPPTDELIAFLIEVSQRLCDAGFHYLAAHCVLEMGRIIGDDELGVVLRSLNW
ncbi:tetratricopeptide repeat protein [Collinsella sp. AGMB00827]|uniref:Tetratricopeptide repeat protein n=1 Tax=Collinsella ureilytica TaxID=2869515 RepID=A0ABS7MJK2_9ACTN|nr:tetratricopeptide repeat protein [Collinsella urealyticum]MBY4797546.1 tetratricopeptide repeat protein [Collinsella urealyticum]